MAIELKNLDQLKSMRKAGLVVADTLQLLKQSAQVGMTTLELNEIAVGNLSKHSAKSSFLGYHGFPAVICASVNEEVVHGIPNKRKLISGDVLSIDFGAIIDDWHGDAAISFGLGEVDPADQKLMDVCEESMWRGIAAGKKGGKLTDISAAIESYINSQGKYGILREYGGHGIGSAMHQEPHILNFGPAGNGPELVPGMALALEPMITRGNERTKVLSDDWTVVSQDSSKGAHFEHTYTIAPDGKAFVLTSLDGGKEQLARLGIPISDLL
ncbi:methionyl aminopeptidase [Candidatus Nanopelagicus abundans]|uniref:Methionine aminopeptidase n=1 Tax=Candidatus Nanopelagicus abundans TaxID=1884916 RepID=A0A249L2Z1_9ACTN|nr:type I methionyl aminopeptidase [Candidatus Nanopelagicus abundans]ASY23448.1 methionyl aminopeptidase [Candidatus Nanopelagicus abundans]